MTLHFRLPRKDLTYARPHEVIIICVPFHFQKYPSGTIKYICAIFMAIVEREKLIAGSSMGQNKTN